MAKKGSYTRTTTEWAKHLRKYSKHVAAKAERKAAKAKLIFAR